MFQVVLTVSAGVGGLFCVAIGLLNLAQVVRFVSRAHTAPGIVVAIVELEKRPIGRSLYQARVRFRTHEGQDVQFDNRSLTGTVQEVAGQRVTVLYDPAKPSEAMIYTVWMWLNPTIALLSGVILSVIGVVNLIRLVQ